MGLESEQNKFYLYDFHINIVFLVRFLLCPVSFLKNA
jgi:hypothetical protein